MSKSFDEWLFGLTTEEGRQEVNRNQKSATSLLSDIPGFTLNHYQDLYARHKEEIWRYAGKNAEAMGHDLGSYIGNYWMIAGFDSERFERSMVLGAVYWLCRY